jgi:hypothetical protein
MQKAEAHVWEKSTNGNDRPLYRRRLNETVKWNMFQNIMEQQKNYRHKFDAGVDVGSSDYHIVCCKCNEDNIMAHASCDVWEIKSKPIERHDIPD